MYNLFAVMSTNSSPGDLVLFLASDLQIRIVNPLLFSLVVGDVAYETLVMLSRCTASPLCNWGLDIAAALRLIINADDDVLLNLIPSAPPAEVNGKPSSGLFVRVMNGVAVSCKSGSLPVDSFTFIFPVGIPYSMRYFSHGWILWH